MKKCKLQSQNALAGENLNLSIQSSFFLLLYFMSLNSDEFLKTM